MLSFIKGWEATKEGEGSLEFELPLFFTSTEVNKEEFEEIFSLFLADTTPCYPKVEDSEVEKFDAREPPQDLPCMLTKNLSSVSEPILDIFSKQNLFSKTTNAGASLHLPASNLLKQFIYLKTGSMRPGSTDYMDAGGKKEDSIIYSSRGEGHLFDTGNKEFKKFFSRQIPELPFIYKAVKAGRHPSRMLNENVVQELRAGFQEQQAAGKTEQLPLLPASTKNFFISGLAEAAINAMQFSQKKGMQELKFQLQPEHLGQLKIKVFFKKGKIDIHLAAENPQAKELLQPWMGSLRTRLAEHGIQLENFSINLEQEETQDSYEKKDQKTGDRGHSLSETEETKEILVRVGRKLLDCLV